MKIAKISYLSFILSFIFFSCDKVEDPIPKDLGSSLTFGGVEHIVDVTLNIEDSASLVSLFNNNSWIEQVAPDNSNRRFVVVEEFTGHKCLNCPKGTKEVVRLTDKHAPQVIPVGIHAGTFARPKPRDKYTTDFRVAGDHEEEYIKKWNEAEEYPRAIVSRRTNIATSDASWSAQIDEIINDNPLVQLDLKTYFDSTSQLIRANCKITWIQTLPEQYNLQLFVLEDSIVDWQLDGPIDVEFYNHRFVLRKVVNGTFGKSLNPATQGEIEELQYVFPFTESLRENNLQNIEVVAFIFDNDPSSEFNEIIQGNATKVLK